MCTFRCNTIVLVDDIHIDNCRSTITVRGIYSAWPPRRFAIEYRLSWWEGMSFGRQRLFSFLLCRNVRHMSQARSSTTPDRMGTFEPRGTISRSWVCVVNVRAIATMTRFTRLWSKRNLLLWPRESGRNRQRGKRLLPLGRRRRRCCLGRRGILDAIRR